MEIVFEIKDKSGRKIHLSKERWKHIVLKHPDIGGRLEEIKQVLEKPDLIISHKFDDAMRNYYKYYKSEKCYLLISVKYLNGKGFVATSFFTEKAMKR
ncbi:MAG: PBECR2 nuclease fold domain-containing protein [Nanoarchaeota archaeon]